MENDPPPDIPMLLDRIEALEREVARIPQLEAENARLKAELARKERIIAGLQQRLFGSSSEKLDPAQLQLLFDEIVLGKPAPPPQADDEQSGPEEEKPKESNPHFSAFRSGPTAVSGAARQKQIPSSNSCRLSA